MSEDPTIKRRNAEFIKLTGERGLSFASRGQPALARGRTLFCSFLSDVTDGGLVERSVDDREEGNEKRRKISILSALSRPRPRCDSSPLIAGTLGCH